jgi:hypothetical protein
MTLVELMGRWQLQAQQQGPYSITSSAFEQLLRHGETEHPGGLGVDGQLQLG